jgi:dihydrofolate reductase
MHGAFRIHGLAIASIEGCLADHTGLMPNSLKLEADQKMFEEACEKADVLIHGRKSHEGQPNSARRRRLIMTRRIPALAPVEDNPNAWRWNPAGATLEEACAAVGCFSGTLDILGGPDVYSHFLPLGYDMFVLNRAVKVSLPGGVPVFAEMRQGRTAEDVLASSGLRLAEHRMLDEDVALAVWTP